MTDVGLYRREAAAVSAWELPRCFFSVGGVFPRTSAARLAERRLTQSPAPLASDGCDAVILGRRKANIEQAAAELSKSTGRKCIGIQADVRKLETLEAAVKQTVAELGRIDFVVAGAAGNFLAPIDGEFTTISSLFPWKRCTRRIVPDAISPARLGTAAPTLCSHQLPQTPNRSLEQCVSDCPRD